MVEPTYSFLSYARFSGCFLSTSSRQLKLVDTHTHMQSSAVRTAQVSDPGMLSGDPNDTKLVDMLQHPCREAAQILGHHVLG